MSTVSWPASLPDDFLSNGYTETPGENVLREETEVGPSKTRRRSTVEPVQVSGTVSMTRAQFQIWDRFYKDTLVYGTVPFAMKSLDGTLRSMYVIQPPIATLRDPYVEVALVCEYLP